MSGKITVRVRSVMKPEFAMINGMATIDQALVEMRRHKTKCMIVEKRHNDDEYGILLISDIARQVIARDRASSRVNVYEVMAKPVISIDPEMDIRYCARLFDRFDISRAPVLEGGQAIGIVSFSDLVLKGMLEKA